MLEEFKLELHINGSTSFTRKYGKKVKAVEGRYDPVRKSRGMRFVFLPYLELGLADQLVSEYPYGPKNTPVILRHRQLSQGAVFYILPGQKVSEVVGPHLDKALQVIRDRIESRLDGTKSALAEKQKLLQVALIVQTAIDNYETKTTDNTYDLAKSQADDKVYSLREIIEDYKKSLTLQEEELAAVQNQIKQLSKK